MSDPVTDAVPGALFHIGDDLPPALPERAAWGTAQKLRQWQQEALELYFSKQPRDFMAVATPGAGKTTFALRVAKMLLEAGTVSRIAVVAPTEHLKRQWADSAARIGVAIDPNFKNSDGRHGDEYIGVALTYAQVASKPVLHRNRTENARTLVILDEIHHGGDALSWGDGIREAFEPATRRLSLTGTPFRSDTATIPFVEYVEYDDGIRRSKSDYTYGYGPALRDHVVRPVIFMAYSGQMRWKTSTGDIMEAQLGEAATKDITAQAWRTALNPEGEWVPSVLAAADRRLTEVRRNVPDAGALVIATDHEDARAYAAQLTRITGEEVTVVLSDDKGASDKIEEFSAGTQRWMVAVRMVSEGVDVPRLCVGVYATSTSTPLFFAQAVGRFVRSRKRGETASVFLPSVPQLMLLANEMEAERDHALDRPESAAGVDGLEDLSLSPEEDLLAAANRLERASDSLTKSEFKALESQASFDKVLFDGSEFGTGGAIGSEDELDFLGIPGLLDAEQVGELLRQRQADQLKRRPKTGGNAAADQVHHGAGPGAEQVVDHRRLKQMRSELSKNVSAWSARSGTPHGMIHNRLREISGGPAVPQATAEQLETRLKTLQGWFVGRK
ncbi:DEAD/DEAH box helicase [Citricoccus sp. K5]|uniref:DEAD/DEAH box helicase n=1 Tax=Citricoccus sp. K5 TaxID=2653135 RepID=UPI0012F16181|nr:DEAD/DEAH box helicase [Citricoccus sp. K5]VXB17400.1 Superfamily II DNA or RNA helicase [Citricoccus sp. K5]